MLDRAEVVGDPVLAAVADEQDVHVAELGVAVRAPKRAGVDVGWLGELAGLPVRALDRPGDDVLEAAEDCPPSAGGLVGTKAVAGLDPGAAPGAAFVVHAIG